ncbi:MAG: threonine synthase [Chloroflexi bacterium]|nr:threonine synthase [Chloroflexota bacterium]
MGVLARYGHLIDAVTESTPQISLGEGSTPLIRSRHLESQLGVGELYFKLEGMNPTGSFKDRGMVVAVAKAVEDGCTGVICASTGNTSASASAYGSACGLESIVVVPKGNIAAGKLAQASMYGARVVAISGLFDDALDIVRSFSGPGPIKLVNSINPDRIEGQKTASFEIIDELGDAPDDLFIPVGNAGNITAYWRGFKEYREMGNATRLPRMMGFQAAGAAPLVLGHPVEEPETVASAIRIGRPASWKEAVTARDDSGGLIDSVTDEQIMDAYSLLAGQEGIFGEPASAASVAGLAKYAAAHPEMQDRRVVCIITGNGLKDPDNAMAQGLNVEEAPADLAAVQRLLGMN